MAREKRVDRRSTLLPKGFIPPSPRGLVSESAGRLKGEKMNARLIGIMILLTFLVILAVQNYQPVTVKFLFWAYETSMVLVVLVSLLIGGLVGGLALWLGGTKKKKSPQPPYKD
jgi:uncharacterized integral membrane protein